MIFIYNLLLIILYPVYILISYIHPKVKLFRETRIEGKKRIQTFLTTYKHKKKIWLHASSAGELDQALAIYRVIKQKYPEIPILITVFSLSVKNIDKLPSEGKAYLPLDFFWQWNFKDFNVHIFITFTWDTFPNLLSKLKKRNCKTYLCSAAIETHSYRITYAPVFRFFYENFDGIGVVDEENLKNFNKLYSKDIKITGDTRYDSIIYKLENSNISKLDLEKLKLGKEFIIFASTYKECDLQLYPHIHKIFDQYANIKLWIFPHHVEEERIQETIHYLNQYNIKEILLYSDNDFKKKYKNAKVIVIDKLGILAHAYKFSKICYVGGGFTLRIHNTGEPAACGSIPFTGPKIETSPIAKLLWKNELLYRCNNGDEIVDKMLNLYNNKTILQQKQKQIKSLLYSQKNASILFYNTFLKNLIEKN